MKTLYFPFTAIEPRWAARMSSVWDGLTLLQPSAATCLPETRRLQETGHIDLLYPVVERPGDLPEALEAFAQWAARNTGRDKGALREQGRSIPLYDALSSSRIADAIRQGGKRPLDEPDADSQGALFSAQLFLALAQQYDQQQAELTQAIDALAAREDDMMARLKGEEGIEAGPARSWRQVAAGASSKTMIDLRLKSWARLMTAARGLADQDSATESGILFLTDDPAVLVLVGERFPEMELRLQSHLPLPQGETRRAIEALPAWLAEPLRRTAEESDSLTGAAAGIDLAEIPATPVAAFFRRLSGQQGCPDAAACGKRSPLSCWIGCMTPAGRRGGIGQEDEHSKEL